MESAHENAVNKSNYQYGPFCRYLNPETGIANGFERSFLHT